MTNRLLLLAVLLLAFLGTPRIKTTFAQTATTSAETAQNSERNYGRTRINAERGLKITLGNRTTGRITVNGWDRDVIEAHAVSER
ncbi:MAG TPA: hypothetical protein VFH31_12985, partial [Pyrinomonadaceae bacterium]|nr:hypothetical protein [Pyrinomonadaceae bacterium]